MYCCLACKTFFDILLHNTIICPLCYSLSSRKVYDISVVSGGGDINAFTIDTRQEFPVTYYSETCVRRNKKFVSVWDKFGLVAYRPKENA